MDRGRPGRIPRQQGGSPEGMGPQVEGVQGHQVRRLTGLDGNPPVRREEGQGRGRDLRGGRIGLDRVQHGGQGGRHPH